MTPRWMLRFESYQRAFALLRAGVESMEAHELNPLEQEGLVQRFEYTWELSWKVLRDYLEHSGVVLPTITPSAVIKAAFAANLISKGEIWMEALDARNKMSHTSRRYVFDQVIQAITTRYFALFDDLHFSMLGRFLDESPKA